jgi:hypothetical protein
MVFHEIFYNEGVASVWRAIVEDETTEASVEILDDGHRENALGIIKLS